MWVMGPEELMVRSKVDPRAELAQYARFEGSPEAVRATDALLRRELEFLPVKRSRLARFVRWAKGERRYERAPLAAAPALCRETAPRARAAADAKALDRVGLAALPAIEAEGRAAGGAAPGILLPFLSQE